jgi:hypothetical protein
MGKEYLSFRPGDPDLLERRNNNSASSEMKKTTQIFLDRNCMRIIVRTGDRLGRKVSA